MRRRPASATASAKSRRPDPALPVSPPTNQGRRVKCQQCGEPATVHQTTLVGGHKQELHLCRDCAEERQLIQNKELSLPAIVQSLIGQHIGPEMDELSRLACPVCGIRYMEFRSEGRLGCPNDYTIFTAGLDGLLYRIHRGTRHAGK